MSIDPHAVFGFVLKNPVIVVAATVLALVALASMWRAGRGLSRVAQRSLKGKRPEDVLTFTVAGLVTAICAQGMFKFFGDKLAMPPWMQGLCFGVLELGMLTCALRARRKIRNPQMGTAGIDGALVWVIAGISALLSATDAHGAGIIARLIFPFIAAVMWELALAYEKRRVGRSTINWKITPDKLLVRLGLAEASSRSVGEVDTHRRLKTVALAAHRLHILQSASGRSWRVTRARRRLDSAMRALVEFTDFTRNHSLQDDLLAMIATLNGAASLADVSQAPPWERPDPVSVMFDDARVRFAPLIAGVPEVGTEATAEIGTGSAPDAGTPTQPDAGLDTGTAGADSGSEYRPSEEKPTRSRGRRRTGRRTGSRTASKSRGEDGRTAQLDRARKLNAAHMQRHGRPISGDKLAAELHVSKTTALDLLREVKQLRKVDPAEGVA